MVSSDGLKAFFKKHGFRVYKVEVGHEGFAVHINRPQAAKTLFSSLADNTHLLFIMHKPWWEKLLWWRK